MAGAFGVRGEARLKPFTADPLAVGAYGPVETEDGARRFTLSALREIKGGVAARLSGVTDRDAAEALRGVRLYVARAALPEPEPDEFYHADLIGVRVVGLDGAPLGRVAAVFDHGAGDFLEVSRPGARPALLPFTRAAVPHVDLAAGELVADPPQGVFDDADAAEAGPEQDDAGPGDAAAATGRGARDG
ncbi:MAG: ribosome maturation factor RimM [Pseudomonadota bacterium]